MSLKYPFKKFFTFVKCGLVALIIIIILAPEWPAFQDERYKIETVIGPRKFDFLLWEADAFGVKGDAFLTAGHTYLSEETRKEFVLEYLALLGEVRREESQINSLFADPSVTDPDTTARDIQTDVTEKRQQLVEWQPVVEAILQEQVSTILTEEGFDTLNLTWPPVQMHMTPLPFVLVVSPRDEIRQIYSFSLEPGLATADQEQIESSILDKTDLSALVVPIGGVGLYPSMILETSDINFLASTIAHEWTHHWLTLHPLGLSYAASPGLRTINETVASIVGDEVGAIVVERYYPEFVPEEAPEESSQPESDEPVFNFRAEMAETRIQVDALLADGKVEEAEAYMEQRRLFFWDHGYRIRKLNQAYFAFYGAYADTPGQTGSNPIGPTLVTLRQNNDSLRGFLDEVAPITSVEQLFELTGVP
ncbi:MAG: hypothetical protein WAM60_17655 [Candidatus Promineifilaceae bacterium]